MAQNQKCTCAGEGNVENPQHQRESRGLGSGSEQRRDRRGRAFVNVRPVNVERRSDDFESESDENQSQPQNRERRQMAGRGDELIERRLHLIDARGSGGAVDHGDAVQEERGGERAQDEIFQRRFVRFGGPFAEAGQDVARNRAYFEADEGGQQFVRARQDPHAGGSEQHQRVKLTALEIFVVEIIDGAEHAQRGRADDHGVRENTEQVGANQLVVGVTLVQKHQPQGSQRHERADEGHPAQRALPAAPQKGSSSMMMMPNRHRMISGATRCKLENCSAEKCITDSPALPPSH